MTQTKGKMLVIRGGAIGDFILTLPVLTALRRQFPETHLELLGYPHIAQLALAGGLVERVQSIEARALAGFFARGGELSENLTDYFSEFDIIISYLYDPDGIFEANVTSCAHGTYFAGPHRPDDSRSLHATEVFLKPLEQLAIFDADTTPKLEIEPAQEALKGRWLAVHPGSGSERKNWPESKWRELLVQLVEGSDSKILLVGGEAERDRLERLQVGLPAERVKPLQSAALPELAGWLAGCEAFAGHDSGISHLAAAVGTPGLILWGDSVETVWRPRGKNLCILRDEHGLEALSVPVVRNHLEGVLKRGRSATCL